MTKCKTIEVKRISQKDLEDQLCQFCPLQNKGVYSVPGGAVAGCEGSKCNEAYEEYLETLIDESVEE